ncbi:MAG: M15 family metallopeptidase [Chitinophagales bacterium]|jgi:D-alanyl-D-alanine dipeptidase|nr:M15 family metallopeptidase [Sphingobacteriales bacterium]
MQKNIMTILGGVRVIFCFAFLSFVLSCQTKDEYGTSPTEAKAISVKSNQLTPSIKELNQGEFAEIFENPHLRFDLRYASENNFLKKKVYPCGRVFLRNEAAEALLNASEICQKQKLKLVVFDAYRPLSIQKKMYEMVKNPDYVADPKKGSKHNRGCAVDVGLANANGLLDMGTEFDDFTEKAHYSNNNISAEAKANRLILRTIMEQSGFVSYEKEWWHYNFKKTDYPLSDFQWSCHD